MSQAQFHAATVLNNCEPRSLHGVLPMRLPHPHDRTWGARPGATYQHKRLAHGLGWERFRRRINRVRYVPRFSSISIAGMLDGERYSVLTRFNPLAPDEYVTVVAGDGIAWLRPVLEKWMQYTSAHGDNVHPAVREALMLTQPRSYRLLTFHYPRMSKDAPGMLIYNSCYDKLMREQFTRTSPGKYLRDLFPTLTDTEIRDIVARTSASGEFGITYEMAEMLEVIESGPKSCMKGFDKSTHPYRVYDPAHGWGMAFRKSTAYECETCRAPHYFSRALVNQISRTFVRSYKYGGVPDSYSYACEGLEAWLKTQGFTKAEHWDTNKLARIEHPYEDNCVLVPYVDGTRQTLYGGDVDYFTVVPTTQTYEAMLSGDNTSGYARPGGGDCDDDRWECAHCNEYFDDDDERYWRGADEDEPICSYCYENSYVTAYGRRGRQYIVHEDEARYCEDDGNHYVEGQFSVNGVAECHETGDLRKLDNMFKCEHDGEYYGDDCDHINMPNGDRVFRDNVEAFFRDDWDNFIEWWGERSSDYCTPDSRWAQMFIDACEEGDYDLDDLDDAWDVYAGCCELVKREPALKRDEDETEDEETTEE